MSKNTKSWEKIQLPPEWKVKKYDKVTYYRLGKEAGTLAGYSISVPNAMLHIAEKTKVKYGSPAKTVDTVCDRLIFKSDATVTLSKGEEKKKMTGAALSAALGNSLEAFVSAKENNSKANTPKKQENASERVFEALEGISKEQREILEGTFEEDIYSLDGQQVLRSENGEAYVVASDKDFTVNADMELELTAQAKEEFAYRLSRGEKCFYSDEGEAIMALVGGRSKTYEGLPDEDKRGIDEAYKELFDNTDSEYYDSLPSKEAFSKDYVIKKNWAKYQNYKNDKAYEQNTPYALRSRQIFVCWKFVYYNEQGEPYMKPQKVPFSPHYDGRAKSSSRDGSHVRTWGTFDEACQAVDKYGYDGVGIMFGQGVMGIDIDGCIKDGKISDSAKDIVSRVNSYTEYSPSGTGVHTLCFGQIPRGVRNDTIGLEMYPNGRFFTLTGHRYGNYMKMRPKAETQPVLDEIYNENFSHRETAAITNPVGAPTEKTYTSKEIVKKLTSAPKMAEKFKRLCQGLPPFEWDSKTETWTDKVDRNFLKEDGSPDMSKLDYAFCKMLVFYRATAEQIDEIYRAQDGAHQVEGLTVEGGGLARDKWERQQGATTYGQYVINNAFRGVSALYEPDTAKEYAKGFIARKKSNSNVME